MLFKILKLLCALLLLGFLFTGCAGPDGDVYISYYWDTAPDLITDTNPTIPSIIESYTQYKTKPGRYTLTYMYTSTSDSHILHYEIKKAKSKMFFLPGAPEFYTMYVRPEGPYIVNDNIQTLP